MLGVARSTTVRAMLLLSIPTSGLEIPVNLEQAESQDARLAAQLQLLVMRESLPRSSHVRRGLILLWQSTEPMTEELAVDVLARTEKPIECIANVGPSDMLLIRSQGVSGDALLLHRALASSFDERLKKAATENQGRRTAYLWVQARAESMLVHRAAFERWYREYASPTSVGFAFRAPLGAELDLGADLTMVVERVDPPSEEQVDSFPAPLRDMLNRREPPE